MGLEKFGVFEPIFAERVLKVPLHLQLLGCRNHDGGPRMALEKLDALMRRTPPPDQDLAALLGDVNWRPHLVAVAAVSLRKPSPPIIAELWRTLDTDSWVVPQIAAGLSLVDPDFVEQAKRRIAAATGIPYQDAGPTVEQRRGWRIARMKSFADEIGSGANLTAALHSATGPEGTAGRNDKAVQALLGLVATVPEERMWVDSLYSTEEVKKALMLERGQFVAFAVQWRADFQAALQAASG